MVDGAAGAAGAARAVGAVGAAWETHLTESRAEHHAMALGGKTSYPGSRVAIKHQLNSHTIVSNANRSRNNYFALHVDPGH